MGEKIEISHAVRVKAVFIILPQEAGTGKTQSYNVLLVLHKLCHILVKFSMGT